MTLTVRPLCSAAAALVAVSATLFSPSAAAYCYLVYGPSKDIIYRAPEPPIDMSRKIHEVLPLVAVSYTHLTLPTIYSV